MEKCIFTELHELQSGDALKLHSMHVEKYNLFKLKWCLTAVLLVCLIATVVDAVAVHELRETHAQVSTGKISEGARCRLLCDVKCC